MKNRFILCLAIIATLLMYACKKNNDQADDTNFYITALKNGSAWSTKPFTGILSDTLYIQGYDSNNALMMKIKFGTFGKYILTANQGNYVTTVGGDAVTGKYTFRADTINQVTITSYDADKQIFEGTFDLSFIQTYPVLASPAKVSFSKGKFRIPRGNFAL